MSSSDALRWAPLAIASFYGFAGALWIGYSDQFVARLGLDSQRLTQVQQYKGWGYVIVTAVILYFILRFTIGRLVRSMRALRRSRDRLTSVNRLYRMLRAVNGSMLAGSGIDQVFEETCRVAVAQGGYRMAWVAMRDPDGRRVRGVAHSGPGEALIRSRVIDSDALTEESPAGRALIRGKPTFLNRCRSDALLDGGSGGGSELGYAAVAAVPFFCDEAVVGAFSVYSIRPNAFDRDEARLLIEIGHSLSQTVSAYRTGRHGGAAPDHDSITGLPGRSLLHQRIHPALGRASRRRERAALLVLDIDDFRRVNDTLGRTAGDDVLRTVSELLGSRVKPGDSIHRLGDDEFAVLLNELPTEESVGMAVDQIAGCFPQRIKVDGQEVFISISIGVALYPDDALDADELFARAELALHSHPADSRGQIGYYAPELNEHARRQRELEFALRTAVPERDFHLDWQPIVDIDSGTLVGAEALLRWRHPTMGVIPPQTFIPLAELSGEIIPIGRWVLEQAIAQGEAWAREGLFLDVHVNVSLLQLQHAGFVDELERQMKRLMQIGGWNLVIEITESQLMADPEATASACKRMKALGCRIDLDDFGTGYSGLNYLTRLPLDGLKLDRSFVVRAEVDPATHAVVEAVARMAGKLGLEVIAEGVETRAQLELVSEFGCQRAQGYLFGRPTGAADVQRMGRATRAGHAVAGQSG